jgi:hypothetical protein
MLMEPLADVAVNVPGVIAILVAPVVAQLSVLLEPEFMVVGFAAKEVMVGVEVAVGWEPFPGDELDEPHFTRPTLANRTRTSAPFA